MEMIRVGDNHYDVATLTDVAKGLLSDMQKVEGELGRLSLQTSITNFAKSALVEKLVAEVATLPTVPAPVAEAPAEAPAAQ
jgi:hypothetical protein